MDDLELYEGFLIVKDPRDEQFYIYELPDETECGKACSLQLAKSIINAKNTIDRMEELQQ